MAAADRHDSLRAIRNYDLKSDASPLQSRNGKAHAAAMLETPVVKHVVPSDFSATVQKAVEDTQKKEHRSLPRILGEKASDTYKPNVTEADIRSSLAHQVSDEHRHSTFDAFLRKLLQS